MIGSASWFRNTIDSVAGSSALRASAAHRFRAWMLEAWYPLAMPLITFEEVAQLNFLFVDGWRDRYLLAIEEWLFTKPPVSRDAATPRSNRSA